MKCTVCSEPTKQMRNGEYFPTCWKHSGKAQQESKTQNKEEIMNALRILYQEIQELKNILNTYIDKTINMKPKIKLLHKDKVTTQTISKDDPLDVDITEEDMADIFPTE